MGQAEPSATIIIGCRIDIDDLYEETVKEIDEEKHRSCQNRGTGKFCSACGELLWEEFHPPIKGFDEDGGELYTGSLDGWDVIPHTTHHWSGRYIEHKMHFLAAKRYASWEGAGENMAKRMGCMKLPKELDITVYREQLKTVLEPRGLWDEEAFGVYVFWE